MSITLFIQLMQTVCTLCIDNCSAKEDLGTLWNVSLSDKTSKKSMIGSCPSLSELYLLKNSTQRPIELSLFKHPSKISPNIEGDWNSEPNAAHLNIESNISTQQIAPHSELKLSQADQSSPKNSTSVNKTVDLLRSTEDYKLYQVSLSVFILLLILNKKCAKSKLYWGLFIQLTTEYAVYKMIPGYMVYSTAARLIITILTCLLYTSPSPRDS